MPFKIQRVPRGLSELLSIFGGQQPVELEDRVRGMLDLLQFYGLQQRQTAGNVNAALTEGAQVSVTPSASSWTVLFGVQASVTKTATATALRVEIFVNRGANGMYLFGESLGPFGATETGTCSLGGYMPYPLMLPPGSTLAAQLAILGTDANATVSVQAEFGTLG